MRRCRSIAASLAVLTACALASADRSTALKTSSAIPSKDEIKKAAHFDPETFMIFPRKMAGLFHADTAEYDDSGLGYSLRYDDAAAVKADIYVYDKGLPFIPDGCRNEIVESEAVMVAEMLKLMEENGSYEGVKHLTNGIVPAEGDIQHLWDRYEYVQPGDPEIEGPRLSDRLITGFGGKFVKLSITYPKEDASTGNTIFTNMTREISALLKKAAPAYEEKLRTQVLSGINALAKAPLSADASQGMALIMYYAESSDDVTVIIGPKQLPWLEEEMENSHILLASYVAGNIRPQIENKQDRDHSYDGILSTISTYKQLRAKKAIVKIDSIEEWIKKKKAGKLEEFIKNELAENQEDEKK